MEVTFSEGGRYKFACYCLTYEESKSPDRIAKIKANLASKGKDGYSIAITYDASPTDLSQLSSSGRIVSCNSAGFFDLPPFRSVFTQRNHSRDKSPEGKIFFTAGQIYVFVAIKVNSPGTFGR